MGNKPLERIKHVVALSGGKDSTAMALRLVELNPGIEYEFVCTPTGDELPPMQAHFTKLEQLLGTDLKRLPNLTLEECIHREGMIPNFRARFCTRILKIEPFIDYMDSLAPGSIMYVGLRADETGRLGLIKPGSVFVVNCPMQEWGWTIEDVNRYLECRGVEIPKRTDCGACFFQKLTEWYDLWNQYPARYASYCAIEEQYGHTFRSPQRDTWPASLAELAEEFKKGRVPKPRKQKLKSSDKCRFCTM